VKLIRIAHNFRNVTLINVKHNSIWFTQNILKIHILSGVYYQNIENYCNIFNSKYGYYILSVVFSIKKN